MATCGYRFRNASETTTACRRILRKSAGIKINSQEITNRILVFSTIQAAQHIRRCRSQCFRRNGATMRAKPASSGTNASGCDSVCAVAALENCSRKTQKETTKYRRITLRDILHHRSRSGTCVRRGIRYSAMFERGDQRMPRSSRPAILGADFARSPNHGI